MAGVASSDPLFASHILASAADFTERLAHTKVHASYVGIHTLTQVPIAILSLVHAVRISHATRLVSGGAQSRLHLFQSVVLDLIVLFGGSTVVGMCGNANTALLLAAPLPVLIAPLSIVLYASVHTVLFFTGLGDVLLRVHAKLGFIMDLLLASVDAVYRSEAIAHCALTQVLQHPNQAVSHSLFAQLVVGALLSGGVPLLVGVFHLNSPAGHWSFGTPPWVYNPSLLLYPDLLGGMVVPLVFLFLTSTGAEQLAPFASLQGSAVDTTATHLLSRILARRPAPLAEKPMGRRALPYLAQREAKVVSALVLFVILAVPIVVRHARVLCQFLTQQAPVRMEKNTKLKANKASKTRGVPTPAPASAPGAAGASGTAVPSSEGTAPRKRGRPKKLP